VSTCILWWFQQVILVVSYYNYKIIKHTFRNFKFRFFLFRRRFNRREAMPLHQAGLKAEVEDGEVQSEHPDVVQLLLNLFNFYWIFYSYIESFQLKDNFYLMVSTLVQLKIECFQIKFNRFKLSTLRQLWFNLLNIGTTLIKCFQLCYNFHWICLTLIVSFLLW